VSTLKSSAEDLTLNADGSGNDIKFQSNGVEKASIDQDGNLVLSGNLTSVGIDDNASGATAITIDSSENVGIGHPLTTHAQKLVVKKNFVAASNAAGAIINIVNEQGAGNFASIRFTGTNQNAYLGYRDDTTTTGRRLSIGVGADSEHFSFTSNGLTFNGDTAAANALDDYEEGTWTPTISGTSTCSMSTIHNSDYTKIGSLVNLYTSFNVTSSATPATGALIFGGFPFAFKTLGEGAFLITVYYNYRETPMAFINTNGNTYYQNTTVGGNNVGDLTAALDANNTFGMTFTYLTDA